MIGNPDRRFRADLLQPGIIRRCVKRKVSGHQVAEIGFLCLVVAGAFAVWFMVGVATGWVI